MKQVTVGLLLLCFCGAWAQSSIELLSNKTYPFRLSNIWGYTAPDGAEYALVGTEHGVSIVDLSDPAQPIEVAAPPGETSIWRELKTWGHYAYATNESGGGLAIIDLAFLPDSAPKIDFMPTLDLDGTPTTITTSHALFIDEVGHLFLTGNNHGQAASGCTLIFDLTANPLEPVYLGKTLPYYTHDCYARDGRLYNADIFEGMVRIYDITDVSSPQLLAICPTPSGFTHNVWLSDDGETMFTTDERANAYTAAFDITDLNNIVELDRYRRQATEGRDVIPHNVLAHNDYLVLSNYTDGVTVLDAFRPDNLVEVAHFDTYDGPDGGFYGCWGVYPYFPSGLLVASDIHRGLFVLRPHYARAAYLDGYVTDATTGAPIYGAKIAWAGTPSYTFSGFGGAFSTGTNPTGPQQILVSKAGYRPEMRTLNIPSGQQQFIHVPMYPAVSEVNIHGQVLTGQGGAPIAHAQVLIAGETDSVLVFTDEQGHYQTIAPEGLYNIFVGKWGFVGASALATLIQVGQSEVNFYLNGGYSDDFNLDLGWTSSGDAPQGQWERAVPLPLAIFGGVNYTNPSLDSPQDDGNVCFLTQNAGDQANPGDVTGGTVVLTSPGMDLSGMGDPLLMLDYRLICLSREDGYPTQDSLLVYLESPTGRALIATKKFNYNWQWQPIDTVHVKEYLPLDCPIWLRVEVYDDSEMDVVEAGIDHFRVWDGRPELAPDTTALMHLALAPNPFYGTTTVTIASSEWCGEEGFVVELYTSLGQLILRQSLPPHQESFSFGVSLPAGVYFVKVVSPLGESAMEKIVKSGP